ncbi:DUF2202 domain-containing protein [Salinispira pacifica]
MKRTSFILTVFVIVAGSLFANGSNADAALFADKVALLPAEPLSAAEIEGLLKMREEEKLARDVYLALGEKWNQRSFTNIAAAEQTHMDYVKLLLDRYGIADPAADDARGVFTDPAFAALYSKLVAKGSTSPVDALKVGALIEELDIADLQDQLSSTNNADLRVLYLNLDKGSRNHLRAYDRQLSPAGASYEPVHISRTYYNRIIDSDQEAVGIITDPDYRF